MAVAIGSPMHHVQEAIVGVLLTCVVFQLYCVFKKILFSDQIHLLDKLGNVVANTRGLFDSDNASDHSHPE